MKTRFFIAAIACWVATVGLRAESELDPIVARATRDPKNAPLIVTMAAEENPKLIVQIAAATVAALPDQAVGIVGALLKTAPLLRTEILRAAILAQPKLAVEITAKALAMFPDQVADIVKTAGEVAPENLRAAIAVLGDKSVFFDSTGAKAAPARGTAARPAQGSFPIQTLRPDLVVSPSR